MTKSIDEQIADILAKFAIQQEQADARYKGRYWSRKGIGDDDEEYDAEYDASYRKATTDIKAHIKEARIDEVKKLPDGSLTFRVGEAYRVDRLAQLKSQQEEL